MLLNIYYEFTLAVVSVAAIYRATVNLQGSATTWKV